MQRARTPISPAEDLVIVKSTTLPVAPSACFRLFTEATELATWLCERAVAEARVGGPYELFWNPADAENDSTIGCRVTALQPLRLLAFQWRSPRQFKAFANAADPLTHVVVTFHADGDGTAVTLVHSGWRSAPEWIQAAQWQDKAWDFALQALAARAAGLPPGED